MAKAKPLFAQAACVLILLFAAFCVGTSLQPQPSAKAAVRKAAPKPHFLSGSERSLPILQEISQTLKRIDGHLAKIEEMVAAASQRQDKRRKVPNGTPPKNRLDRR